MLVRKYFVYIVLALVVVVALYIKQTGKSVEEGRENYNPEIDPADFVSEIDNKYFTLTASKNFTYQAEAKDGVEKNIVVVTNKKKDILGVSTTEVWDRVWLNDELIEETLDWYAQEKNGNVWYFGEDSKEYEDGKVVSSKGSWEAGVSGAKPGVIMKGNPKVGEVYRQEYLMGEAEDMADILSLNETVKVPVGTFSNCLKTRDWSKIDSSLNEYKYYCPSLGNLVLVEVVESGEKVELIKYE